MRSDYYYSTENTDYAGKYFFVMKETVTNRKTPIYTIFEYSRSNILGEIRWYAPWRKFCFYPDKETIWDTNCLDEIIQCLDKYNSEYKTKGLD